MTKGSKNLSSADILNILCKFVHYFSSQLLPNGLILKEGLQFTLEFDKHFIDLNIVNLLLTHLLSHSLKHSVNDFFQHLCRQLLQWFIPQCGSHLYQKKWDFCFKFLEHNLTQLVDQPQHRTLYWGICIDNLLFSSQFILLQFFNLIFISLLLQVIQ